jgi:hypothetical protein
MKQHISFHNLPQAEQYASLAQHMTHLSQEHLEQMGARKIVEFEGATAISLLDDTTNELGPKGRKNTSECDFILYQFKDGSQIWYVRADDEHYLQLRGIYNGRFRHTHFQAAGDDVKELHAPCGYPSLWDKEIDELDLTVRASNCLKSENIYYIGELIRKPEQDIRTVPNLGRVCLKNIKEAMEKKGLKFDTHVGDWTGPKI